MESRITTTIIGIAGASGSGKTTTAQQLLNHYGEADCTIISADNYYKDLSHLTLEERGKINFDHPDSIDFELLAKQLRALKWGASIEIPTYNFATHSREKNKTIKVDPKKIIIIEGILIFHPEEVLEKLDVTIFVETKLETCNSRRIERDIKERGRTREQVLAQLEETVIPMYHKFVAPTQDSANFTFSNNSVDFSMKIDLLIEHVNARIENLAFSRTNFPFHASPTQIPSSIIPDAITTEDKPAPFKNL